MQATEHLSDLVGERVCFAELLGAQKTPAAREIPMCRQTLSNSSNLEPRTSNLEPRTSNLAPGNCFPPKVA
jgi:hypothetical protein